jgi:hypothetical protein
VIDKVLYIKHTNMIEVIIGIVMSIITQIAKKTEIDAKLIILGLSIIS